MAPGNGAARRLQLDDVGAGAGQEAAAEVGALAA